MVSPKGRSLLSLTAAVAGVLPVVDATSSPAPSQQSSFPSQSPTPAPRAFVVPQLGGDDYGRIERQGGRGGRSLEETVPKCFLPPGLVFNKIDKVQQFTIPGSRDTCGACERGGAEELRHILLSAGLCGTGRQKYIHRVTEAMYVAADDVATRILGVDCGVYDFLNDECTITITAGTLDRFDCTKDFFFIKTDFARELDDKVAVDPQAGAIDAFTDIRQVKITKASETTINQLNNDASCIRQSYSFRSCEASNDDECMTKTTQGLATSCPSITLASTLEDDQDAGARGLKGGAALDKDSATAHRQLVLGRFVKFMLTVMAETLVGELTIRFVVFLKSIGEDDEDDEGGNREQSHWAFCHQWRDPLIVFNDGVRKCIPLDQTPCARVLEDASSSAARSSPRAGWHLLLVLFMILFVVV